MKLKDKSLIVLKKKKNIIPIQMFNCWYDAGKYCDENIKKDKGKDPTLYYLKSYNGFKKWCYYLFFNPILTLNKIL